MAELLKLNVLERTEFGKGPNRRLRNTGMVPGVYYDQHGKNIAVKVENIPLQKAYSALSSTQVFDLVLEKDGKTESMPSLMWRMKYDPVTSQPIHIDFFGVDLDKEIKVAVHFEITGTSKGVKLGGRLEQYRETVDVICKPMAIPESIVLDITEMDVMDSVRIEDVVFPEGVTPVYDENYAVITIATARAVEAEESEEGEVAGEAAAEASKEAAE